MLMLDSALVPFYHGVAAGDPLPDGILLWTRITPDKPNDTLLNGSWRLATDTALQQIVQQGNFTTSISRDYTVKIEVTGLQAGMTYYYGFTHEGRNSLTGRAQTATEGVGNGHWRFGLVSCNNYEGGYFNAFANLARRNDLDAVLHLGDYIYENASSTNALPDRAHDTIEAVQLAQYRARYSQYRLDPDLRRVHQQFAFVHVWDDHESANNSWQDGASNHQPATEGPWTERKSVARQAFFEWLPIRESADGRIYRRLDYGETLELIMLDTRLQGRDMQLSSVNDPALTDSSRSLLGDTQRTWLLNRLAADEATWKIIGNQVLMAPFHIGWSAPASPGSTFDQVESLFLDIWDGYPAERQRLFAFLDSAAIDNVVVLTGDFHTSFANNLADPVNDPDNDYAPIPGYDAASGLGSVAVEFMTPSISSRNFDETVGPLQAQVLEALMNDTLQPPFGTQVANPHMKYVDLDQHGYVILDVKPDTVQANWYYVTTLSNPDTTEIAGPAWYTISGENRLQAAAQSSAPKALQALPAPFSPPVDSMLSSLRPDAVGQWLRLYPQPVRDQLFVRWSQQQRLQPVFRLLDMEGRELAQFVAPSAGPGLYEWALTLPPLAAGIYLLQSPWGAARLRVD